MIFRLFFRHFRESVKNLFRNAWMTFASVSAVTVTLLLLGTFLSISMNMDHVAKRIENNVQIDVLLNQSASEEQAVALKNTLENLPGIKSIRFSSKDEQLQNQVEALGEKGKYLELYKQSNPLHDVYIVMLTDPSKTVATAKEIGDLDGVYEVNYGEGYVEGLFSFTKTARMIGIGLIAALFFTTTFLIANTIKITILARSREIEIMRLVGATNMFIRWPFFLEGMWIGFFGSIVPILTLTFSYQYIYDKYFSDGSSTFFSLLPVYPFVYNLAGLLLGFGIVIGIIASLLSIRKHLKV